MRQHERRSFALAGADRADDISSRGALIMWRAGAAAALGPAAGDLVLLANMSFVSEPDCYVGGRNAM